MSIRSPYRGRAKGAEYVPPRPNWTVEQRLEALEVIARRAEQGKQTPTDELEAAAHMAALRRTL